MLSISWLYISKCSCVVSECMWAVMFSFTYKWVLVVPMGCIMMKSLCRNLLHSFVSMIFKSKAWFLSNTYMCALHCYLMSSWHLVHIQSMRAKYLPLFQSAAAADWNTRSISKYTSSIAILLRTVSNVVIYVCDKHVTNIHKIISVGLNLSFRAHSRSSASTYYYVHLQISLDVSRFRICSYCIDFQKKSQPIYHNVQRITSSKYYSSCCSLYLPPCSSL